MFEKIVFFNHYGAGDIFESKEFVRKICKTVPAKEYIYSHGKDKRILIDLPYLNQDDKSGLEINHRTGMFQQELSVYINTWIGRNSTYVLPGIGCTIELLTSMYKNFGLDFIQNPYEFIPRIGFSYINTEIILINLRKFENKRKVLISNGNVQSNQAYNFDFTPVILQLANIYKDIIFFITQRIDTSLDNIVYTGDMFEQGLNFDLNEIGFLSKFCSRIVGRCSGPHVFCQHYDNWMDADKVSISFTYTKEGSHMLLTDTLPMKKKWSKYTETKDVIKVIGEEL